MFENKKEKRKKGILLIKNIKEIIPKSNSYHTRPDVSLNHRRGAVHGDEAKIVLRN
jgi:hypothetical protein